MEDVNRHMEWERKWLEGQISSEEASQKNSLESFDQLKRAVEQTKDFSIPSSKSADKAWQELESKLNHAPQAKVISMTRRSWITGIAASIILAVGAFFLIPALDASKTTTYNTAVAENETLTLPDNSIIHLNAVSQVSFNESQWNDERVIDLEGEAFFEVEPGSKFTVRTSAGSVSVLGTSFNVRVREQELIVACKTGKVQVTNLAKNESVIITPAEMVNVKEDQISEVLDINTSRIATWMDKEFDFESMSLSSVFNELERQYGVSVETDLDRITLEDPLTATLPTDNLDDAIQIIELLKGLEAQVSADKKTIKFNKSN